MKDAIRQRARELGFDDCRITTARAPESAFQFRRWLADKYHGEMAYLERNAPKRIEPQQVLPGAKSIITLAASYAEESVQGPVSSIQNSETGQSVRSGVIARYARYSDYHAVLGERLKVLAA